MQRVLLCGGSPSRMMQLSLIAKMRGGSLPVQLWIVLRLHPTSQNGPEDLQYGKYSYQSQTLR
jgi:hypothetical protein